MQGKILHGAVQLCLLCPEFGDEVKEVGEVRQELVTGSARHVASLIAFCHMQIGALTLKKGQPSLL